MISRREDSQPLRQTLIGAAGTAPIRLQHVGYRWYQPGIGRFVQRDPIGIMGGANTYLYAFANPVTAVDPTGLWTYGSGWRWLDWPAGWIARQWPGIAKASDGQLWAISGGVAVGTVAGTCGAGALAAHVGRGVWIGIGRQGVGFAVGRGPWLVGNPALPNIVMTSPAWVPMIRIPFVAPFAPRIVQDGPVFINCVGTAIHALAQGWGLP